MEDFYNIYLERNQSKEDIRNISNYIRQNKDKIQDIASNLIDHI